MANRQIPLKRKYFFVDELVLIAHDTIFTECVLRYHNGKDNAHIAFDNNLTKKNYRGTCFRVISLPMKQCRQKNRVVYGNLNFV